MIATFQPGGNANSAHRRVKTGFDFMKGTKFRCAPILALFVFSLVSSSACGQIRGARLYSTAESCEVSSGLTTQECHNAFANALAELDEKSPRFRSRAECEKAFKRCMIAGFGRRRVEFEPALRGFAIKPSVTGGGTVVPVVEGDDDLLGFRERSFSRLDTTESYALRAQAQKRWLEAQKARAAVPADERQLGAPPEAVAPPEDPATAAEYDRESAARRAKEIREAPTAY
jgi:Protein of unknown function (DUF1190)